MDTNTVIAIEIILGLLLMGIGLCVALRIVRAGGSGHTSDTLRAPKYPNVPLEFITGEWMEIV